MGSKTLPGMPNIPNGWYWAPLSDLCKKVSVGHVGETSSVFCGPEGVTFLRSQNVRPGRLDLNDVKYVTKAFHEKSKKSQLKTGDILVVRVGQNRGDCAVVPDNVGEINCANIVFAQPKDIRYSDYLGYFLNSSFGRTSLLAVSTGSAQGVLNTKSVAKVVVPVPPIDLAKSIGYRLKLIDNKIELNQKTNQTLEQMAQALFKSWFVDFDPVFDNLLASVDFKLENLATSLPDELKQKAQRRLAALNSLHNAAEIKASLSALAHELQALSQTQSAVQVSEKAAETPVKANFSANPNILAQHANTHAHFPNEFEHNEQLGWIPKGWESKTIDELCKINPESWTKKNAPEVVKYVDLANAKNGSVGEAIEYSFSEAPSRARRILRPHDTIIGVVRPANRSFAYVNEDNLTGSTGFAVVRANNQNCRAFAYFSLTNDDCIQEFTRIADGAAYPAIKPEDVAKTYCVFSNNKILDAFESSIGKFMTKVAKNEQQNRSLTKLRDTLLPKLISGELQIPDVAIDEEVAD